MVPLQVILAGSAAMTFDEACAKIFAEFDPPIVCGTYDEVSKARRETNRELGDESAYRNNQSEHFLPNSAFQGQRGVNASNIPGAASYTEGSAFAYSVYDDQSAGTEHKFLTDAARDFETNAGANPSVAERLAATKENTRQSLLENLKRDKSEVKRSRIKDAEQRTEEEREQLAEAAAECLTQKAAKQFEDKGVKASTPTRKGLVEGAKTADKSGRRARDNM